MAARDSFPRQKARTRGFSLGAPRSLRIADDGSRVAFIRSRAGDDPAGCLWVLDLATGEERAIFDPAARADEENLTQRERDRRERAREQLTGVTTYDADPGLTIATFVVGGQVHVADLVGGIARPLLGSVAGAFDARPDPTGRRVAYVVDGALYVQELAAADDADTRARVLAQDDDPDIHWGVAEFVAAEELERHRGYWWSPDGERIAAASVDERKVLLWHIASPVDPDAPPRAVRYPQAGTENADVCLSILGLDGSCVDVGWDANAYPYLVNVTWNDRGPLTMLVLSRDQKRWSVLVADPASGKTEPVYEDVDEHWQTVVTGVPDRLSDGRLVFVDESEDTRRITVDGEPITPPGLQVDSVLDVGDDVLVTAYEDPTELHVWRAGGDAAPERLTSEPGVHAAARANGVTVIVSELFEPVRRASVLRDGEAVAEIRSLAETPLLRARPRFEVVGRRDLRVALFTPGGREPDEALPVLADPYGGPHFSKVVKAHRALLEPQWLADQGFAVFVADGRGTPGRGVEWEHAVYRDFAGPVLEDQVDALQSAAERFEFLDLGRVGIRGWSFGGYLAAMAVLRRPDVFHAAVAGAPVTDQTLYDTAYTERYLGHPLEERDTYRRNSIVDDAPDLERPLLLIHGLADDNVFVANTLRLTRALTEAGRPHAVVPLSGITHMTTEESVAENLLLLQVRFFRQAFGMDDPPSAPA
ncbi:MAG TPA: prolyl oligopeptidase family serine peptidase [Actinomycetota bacterium]|nr:prolyl oligopeptidase family serine peptidase [Actinomycetota bacterium]